ncbi:exocyst complex component EXO70C1 [Elaeis guineensis]|uniref:Exocyst subunit Exo70 family protein n=1 Tax=Elaeis guineensis var. tenera TaxID=51953 RepID=A0A6I9S889_ELAGV|nr:exocyst complex component EXO70B1 [Elaeis guineensis]
MPCNDRFNPPPSLPAFPPPLYPYLPLLLSLRLSSLSFSSSSLLPIFLLHSGGGRPQTRERELMEKVESPLYQGKSKEENIDDSNRKFKQEEEDKEDQINQGREEEKPDKEATKEDDQGDNSQATHSDATSISADIDHFLSVAGSGRDGQNQSHHDPPEIPATAIERSVSLVEKEITRYESVAGDWSRKSDDLSLLDAIDRISKFSATLSTIFPSEAKYVKAKKRAGAVVQRAMSFLEEEFRSLLEDSISKPEPRSKISKCKKPNSLPRPNHNNGSPTSPETTSGSPETDPIYPPVVVEKLRKIAGVMIAAGYETECCQVFIITRRNAFNDSLTKIGFQKMSIDDIQKMQWESLEGKIAACIKAFKHSITNSFSYERELAGLVFSGHQAIASSLFSNLARGVIIQLLNFAEAVAMTKCSAEKLFKVLDMYEALRDMNAEEMDNLFTAELEGSSSLRTDLQSEISSVRSRLGKAAVAIFCDLESSIKADDSRIPVPSGAIHPLTRYVMNYLKYASEYKNTLEQVFQDHQKSVNKSSGNDTNSINNDSRNFSPFAMQFIEAMDLLDSNLEAKSKLYKDPALSYIFLMNNGRYIMKKIKGSSEIPELLGDSLIRKRSSDLRQYHKNYQREAWSKVLACFKDEGLQVKGNVSKQMVKERFKSFNAMFEEIHRRQSSWVVSDEQMQSELRVSVSAVIVPAYRSFLGRFRQYLSSHKHVKYGADDLENYIDELFSGNPSVGMKKRT